MRNNITSWLCYKFTYNRVRCGNGSYGLRRIASNYTYSITTY
ncbi:hypothetical protein BRC2024_AWKCSVWU_CDS_0027 [Acinetobacter phage vB_AbaP_ABW132]